jgi:hypothetical protein
MLVGGAVQTASLQPKGFLAVWAAALKAQAASPLEHRFLLVLPASRFHRFLQAQALLGQCSSYLSPSVTLEPQFGSLLGCERGITGFVPPGRLPKLIRKQTWLNPRARLVLKAVAEWIVQMPRREGVRHACSMGSAFATTMGRD